ncbi:hypothetical protein ACG92Y_02050 [Acinetobacter ursingii]|uniref:hypothetical protein n=1 Tax=Acinetobacter ursingii TaxID=108980 RepID=UPI003AF624F7
MGFWSSVGSAISSACSAVGSAISGAFGSVSSTFSNAMSNIGSVLSTASTILSALSVAMPQIAKIAAIVDIALTILNLQDKNENVEEIGEKVLQGYEMDIKPADFSTYEEYITAIRNVKLDPEKSEKFNLGEKLAAGITVQAWGMEEKYGQGSSDFLVHILNDAPKIAKGEGYFTESRVQNILDKIKNVADVAKYFSNKLGPDDGNRVEQELVQIEKGLNPNKTVEDIYKELDQHRKD